MIYRFLFSLLLFAFLTTSIFPSAQNTENSVSIEPGLTFPTGFYQNTFETGKSVWIRFSFYPNWIDQFFIEPEIGMMFFSLKNQPNETYSFFPLGINASYHFIINDSFYIPVKAGFGEYMLKTTSLGTFFYPFVKASTGLVYDLSNSYQVGVHLNYLYFMDPKPFQSIAASLSLNYFFGESESGYGLIFSKISTEPVFAAQYTKYFQNPIGKITLENKTGKSIEDLKATLFIKNFMSGKTESTQKLPVLKENSLATIHLFAFFDKNIKYLSADTQTTGVLEVEFKDSQGRKFVLKKLLPIQILHKNALNWTNINHIGSFITLEDKPIVELSRKTLNLVKKSFEMPENLSKALLIFELFKFYQLKYQNDPKANYKILPSEQKSVNFVQYPRETLLKKSGNCVDFSVLFASLLESLGIPTAIVAAPEHVFILFETPLAINGKTVFFQGKNWIPLETTLLNKDFIASWQKAYDIYQETKEKQVRTTLEAITEFPPVTFENDVFINQPIKQYDFEQAYLEEEKKVLKFLK